MNTVIAAAIIVISLTGFVAALGCCVAGNQKLLKEIENL